MNTYYNPKRVEMTGMNLKPTWNSFCDSLFGEPSNQVRFMVCLVVVVGFFFFSRLPFFLYYPLPIAWPDTPSYLWQLEKIEQGILPTFELRTPGYPLFWWLCRMVSHNVLFVIYTQNTITLFSIILTFFLLAKYSPGCLVPVAFGLSVFISSPTHLAMDMSLLSESIFVNCMILFFVFLYAALHTCKTVFALITSLLVATGIYIRPHAAFLIPTLAIVSLFLFKKFGQRFILALVVPAAVALGVLVLYNAFTIRMFTLSGGGDWAMLWSTSIYLEPDPALPDGVNEAIVSKAAKISNSDKDIIYNSWDLVAFQKAIERNILVPSVPIVKVIGEVEPGPDHYLKQRDLCRQIYQTAIRQHPEVYIKNLLGAFILYFMKIGTSGWGDFYSVLPSKQYGETFVGQQASHVKGLKDYYNAKPLSEFKFILFSNGTATVMTKPRTLTKLYSQYAGVRARLFQNMLWIIPLVFGLILSVAELIRGKGASTGSLFIFLMILCPLGHAVLCAVTGHIEKRYSYTLEFINYLLVALVPFVLCRKLKMPLGQRNS